MAQDVEQRIVSLTCLGPSDEWMLEVARSDTGSEWEWRRPVLEETGDYVIGADSWTTSGSLLPDLMRAWPMSYAVSVEGLTPTEAGDYLLPIATMMLTPGDDFVINGDEYTFDGYVLRPNPG